MPRLTPSTYLIHHQQLKTVWETHQYWFAALSPNDQWALHQFYKPSVNLTATELLAHRRAVTAADPSLPHRAGRAYAKLSHGERSRAIAGTASSRAITVRSVVRPEPDLRLLAKVYIRMALEDMKERQNRSAA